MRPITNLAAYVNHNKRSCQQRGQQSLPVLHKLTRLPCCLSHPPRWGAADAEIKVPPGENTELKRSPFKAWSRSVYGHTFRSRRSYDSAPEISNIFAESINSIPLKAVSTRQKRKSFFLMGTILQKQQLNVEYRTYSGLSWSHFCSIHLLMTNPYT